MAETAVAFILSHLYNKLPRRRVNDFGSELTKRMHRKLTTSAVCQLHIVINGPVVDECVSRASADSGLSLHEILSYLPKQLTIVFDPNGRISYQLDNAMPIALESVPFQTPLLPSLAVGESKVSPVSAGSAPLFTTAEFAHTKFGSTKRKSRPRRQRGTADNALPTASKQQLFASQSSTQFSSIGRPNALSLGPMKNNFTIGTQAAGFGEVLPKSSTSNEEFEDFLQRLKAAWPSTGQSDSPWKSADNTATNSDAFAMRTTETMLRWLDHEEADSTPSSASPTSDLGSSFGSTPSPIMFPSTLSATTAQQPSTTTAMFSPSANNSDRDPLYSIWNNSNATTSQLPATSNIWRFSPGLH